MRSSETRAPMLRQVGCLFLLGRAGASLIRFVTAQRRLKRFCETDLTHSIDIVTFSHRYPLITIYQIFISPVSAFLRPAADCKQDWSAFLVAVICSRAPSPGSRRPRRRLSACSVAPCESISWRTGVRWRWSLASSSHRAIFAFGRLRHVLCVCVGGEELGAKGALYTLRLSASGSPHAHRAESRVCSEIGGLRPSRSIRPRLETSREHLPQRLIKRKQRTWIAIAHADSLLLCRSACLCARLSVLSPHRAAPDGRLVLLSRW